MLVQSLSLSHHKMQSVLFALNTSRCHSLAETVEVCLGYDRHVKNCGSLRSYMKCSTSNRTGQNKHTFQVIKILNFYLRTVIVARDHAEWESMCILQWKH